MQAAEHAPAHMPPPSEWMDSADRRPSNITVRICTPPCECEICLSQYRARNVQRFDLMCYGETLSDTQANDLLSEYVTQMNRDRDYIKTVLEKSGNQLCEWWRRKRPSGRTAFLEQVAPELPTSKESFLEYRSWQFLSSRKPPPEIDVMMREKAAERRKHRLAFLVPHLNIPMLATGAYPLLALLDVRGTSLHEDWAMFDNEQLTVQWASGGFRTKFNKGCVVIHGPGYGTLQPWQKDSAHRRDIVGFPRGQLLMEAQATQLSILRRILSNAMQRMGPGRCDGKNLLIDYLQEYRSSTHDKAPWSSYVQQPFVAPPTLNFDTLISEAEVRLNDLEDHLWLLQTEPSYLRRYLRLLGQMAMVGLYKTKDWGAEMLVAELKVHVESAWSWQAILAELKYVKAMYEKFRDSVGPGTPMPPKLNNAMGALAALLARDIDHGARQLRALLHERPAFSFMYDRVHDPATKSIVWKLKDGPDKPDCAHETTTHRLWWCLMSLLGDPDLPTRIPYAHVVGILDDHLASASPKERARLDEVLYDRFSDHISLVKIYETLNLHRPMVPKRNAKDCKEQEKRFSWKRVDLLEKNVGSNPGIISALRAFEQAPVPAGGKSRKWLQDFDNSHAALQVFWASLHNLYEPKYNRSDFTEEEKGQSLSLVQFWKSADYKALVEKKRQRVLSELGRQTIAAQTNLLTLSDCPTMTTLPVKVSKKAKVKTKGQPKDAAPATNKQLEPKLDVKSSTTIAVPKRAMTVFKKMFPITIEERSAEVDWDTFVLSMRDAGFSARNDGGSIVIFEQEKGKIIFHRPHPVPKIDPIVLKFMGRRMNKWFGWTRNTFSLMQKVAAAEEMNA
ncbi:hypothetical protein NX059_001333 [Plenodomus lindquistii]|nr:hypothetical protein NX059_001333 [Plenodomus lindquistii]